MGNQKWYIPALAIPFLWAAKIASRYFSRNVHEGQLQAGCRKICFGAVHWKEERETMSSKLPLISCFILVKIYPVAWSFFPSTLLLLSSQVLWQPLGKLCCMAFHWSPQWEESLHTLGVHAVDLRRWKSLSWTGVGQTLLASSEDLRKKKRCAGNRCLGRLVTCDIRRVFDKWDTGGYRQADLRGSRNPGKGNEVLRHDSHVQEDWYEKGRFERKSDWTEYEMRNPGRKVSGLRQVAKTPLQTQSRISSNKAIQGATVLPSGILKFPK